MLSTGSLSRGITLAPLLHEKSLAVQTLASLNEFEAYMKSLFLPKWYCQERTNRCEYAFAICADCFECTGREQFQKRKSTLDTVLLMTIENDD